MPQGGRHRIACHTRDRRLPRKGAEKDLPQRPRKRGAEAEEQDPAEKKIGGGHKRHKKNSNIKDSPGGAPVTNAAVPAAAFPVAGDVLTDRDVLTDVLFFAPQRGEKEQGEKNADKKAVSRAAARHRPEGGCHGGSLHGISHGKRAEKAEQSEDPAAFPRHIVHRAAVEAVLFPFSVAQGKNGLGVFQKHGGKGGKQHPEKAPGPPRTTAEATPARFPTPSVPARARVSAFRGETPSGPAFLNRLPKHFFGWRRKNAFVRIKNHPPPSKTPPGTANCKNARGISAKNEMTVISILIYKILINEGSRGSAPHPAKGLRPLESRSLRVKGF